MHRSQTLKSGSALLLVVAVTAPALAADPDPAGLAPTDALVYVGWSGVHDGTGEVARVARAVLRAPLIRSEFDDDDEAVAGALEFVDVALRHAGALSLFRDGEQFVGGAVIAAGADAPALAERFGRFAAHLTRTEATERPVAGVPFRVAADHDVEMFWAVHKDHLILALGEPAARVLAGRVDGQGTSLADNREYARALAQVKPSDGWHVTAYAEFRAWLDLFLAGEQSAAAPRGSKRPADDGDEITPEKVIGAIMDERDFGAFLLRFDDSPYGSRMSGFASLGKERRGLAKLYSQAPLTDDDLKRIPADAYWALACNFDLSGLYTESLETLDRIDPMLRPNVEGGLAMVAQFLGFSIPNQLLPALGDTWILYDAPAHGGFLLTGTVLVIEAKDPAALQGMTRRVLEMVTPLAAQGGVTLATRQMQHGKHTIDYVLVGGYPVPIAPACGYAGGRAVIGLFPQTVAVALDQLAAGSGAKSLLDHPDFQKARPHLPAKLTGLAFSDSRATRYIGYTLWQLVRTAAAALSVDTPAAYDLSTAPTFPQDLATARSGIWGSGVTDEGVVSVGLGESPLHVLLGGNITALVAAGVAATLPALADARDQAKRARAAVNLSQIGVACHAYASEHNGKFPPDFAALIEAGIITEQALTSPRSDPPKSYRFIAGQSANGDWRNILAWEPLTGSAGTNALFLDGHVEWMQPAAFEAALRDTYKRLKRENEMPDDLH